MKDKLITVSFYMGLANLVLALAAYDYIGLSRIFGMISLALFFLGFMLILDFGHRKRTRLAWRHNESQKVGSDKDLTIIIHRNPKTVKAGDRR